MSDIVCNYSCSPFQCKMQCVFVCDRQGSVHPSHPPSHVVAHLPSCRPPTCVRLSPSSCCVFAVFDWKKSQEARMEGIALCSCVCVFSLSILGQPSFPFRCALPCFALCLDRSLSPSSLSPTHNTHTQHSTTTTWIGSHTATQPLCTVKHTPVAAAKGSSQGVLAQMQMRVG